MEWGWLRGNNQLRFNACLVVQLLARVDLKIVVVVFRVCAGDGTGRDPCDGERGGRHRRCHRPSKR